MEKSFRMRQHEVGFIESDYNEDFKHGNEQRWVLRTDKTHPGISVGIPQEMPLDILVACEYKTL